MLVGPIGLLYSSYRVVPDLAGQVFANHALYMSTNNKPAELERFSMQNVWFAFKGTHDDDKQAVYRAPGQLRTKFGGNCDSKIIPGATASNILEPTLAVTPFCQRGFCRGRQLALNVVDLDS